MNRAWIGLFLGMLALLAPAAARADAASPWFETDQGRVRLIAAAPSVDGADRLLLGLEFQLQPHWKIYWRSPGDAGYPPDLDWAGSQNLAAAQLSWPAPERFSVLGLETVGYSGAVVLPIVASLDHAGAALRLRAALHYLTCNEICVPYETTLALDVPADAAQGPGYAALIAQYQAQVPKDGSAAGIDLVGAVLRWGSAPVLELRVSSGTPLAAPDAFFESGQQVAFGAPRVEVKGAGETVLRVPVSGDWPRLLGENLAVTLVDGPRAITGTVVPVRGPDVVDLPTLAAMLGLALLGGLILNLMPCVLPVVALKLLAALPDRSHDAAAVRRGLLATAAGVMLSFLVLALASVGLKAAGVAVGWGVQFQDPRFLVFLTVVLALFACDLWGFFELPVPRLVAARAERGALGNLATGAFATLLATPCSAPFLGTAIGFALAAGPREIVAIFLALGLGMASPYLLVAAVPPLARRLPRPGKWMIHLRRALGFLLAGSAAWLVAVLGAEIGTAGGAGRLGADDLRRRRAGPLARSRTALVRPSRSRWRPRCWCPSSRRRRVRPRRRAARGGNSTLPRSAAWCATARSCWSTSPPIGASPARSNERLVLDSGPVRAALARPQVVAMRADWTRPDAAIAAYLNRFGRYGIPFNAVYGPAAPGGIALPELLTQNTVTAALAEAAGSPNPASADR